MRDNSTTRKWLKNLSRSIVCFLGIFGSIYLAPILDQFLSISGAILGIPIILIIPTLCHYKVCAESKREKCIDICVISFSTAVMFLCTYNSLKYLIKS